MHLTVDKKTLERSLRRAKRVACAKSSIQILSNVLMCAKDNKFTLSATDKEIEMVDTIDAEIIKVGSTTVSAQLLHDIVCKLPDGSLVDIALSGYANITIKSGRSRFNLPTLSECNFPSFYEFKGEVKFKIDAKQLLEAINKTDFAMSTEETRHYLNGIYVHRKDDYLVFVATDGHRLAKDQIPLPDGAQDIHGIIIPRNSVEELKSLLKDGSIIDVAVSETKIKFTVGDVVFTSKLVDGTFPDYERVIPSDNNKFVEIDTLALKHAVDRVSLIVTEKGARPVTLKIAKGEITCSANNDDAIEYVETDYKGSGVMVGFNSRYLIDILSVIKSDKVVLEIKDQASPVIIRSSEDKSSTYVLMPMRV